MAAANMEADALPPSFGEGGADEPPPYVDDEVAASYLPQGVDLSSNEYAFGGDDDFLFAYSALPPNFQPQGQDWDSKAQAEGHGGWGEIDIQSGGAGASDGAGGDSGGPELPVEAIPELGAKKFPTIPKGKKKVRAIFMALPTTIAYTGGIINGRVFVNTGELMRRRGSKNPNLPKQLRVRLLGQEHVHWTESESHGSGKNRQTRTVHYRGHAVVQPAAEIILAAGGADAAIGLRQQSETASGLEAAVTAACDPNLSGLAPTPADGVVPAPSAAILAGPSNVVAYDFQLRVPLDYPTSTNGTVLRLYYQVQCYVVGTDDKPMPEAYAYTPITIKSSRSSAAPSNTLECLRDVKDPNGPFKLTARLQTAQVITSLPLRVECTVQNPTAYQLESVDVKMVTTMTGKARRGGSGHEKTRQWSAVSCKAKKVEIDTAAAQQGAPFTIDLQLQNLRPSLSGSIMSVQHTLVIDAKLRNPDKKKGKLAFMGIGKNSKEMKGIKFPVWVASPAEQLPDGWSHMPPDEAAGTLMYSGPGGMLSRESPNILPDFSVLGRNLVVVIHKGRDLVSQDRNGFSDPYVNCWIATSALDQETPEMNKRLCGETKKLKKTLNPDFWREGRNVFNFYIPAGRVPRKMHLECRDWNRIGADDFMGHAVVDLGAVLPFPAISRINGGGMTPVMALHGWVPLGTRPGKKKDKATGAIFVSVGILG